MAWLADKARNLLSRGRGAEVNQPVEVHALRGAKAAYQERKLSMPLDSGRTTLLDDALEHVQRDPETKAVLARAGVPQLTKKQLTEESAADSIRQRGQGLTEDEHRLLTVFVLLGNGDAKFHAGYFVTAESAYREAHKAAVGTRDKSLQAVCLAALAAAVAMQGKYEQALKQVEDALRRKPDLAEAWYNKGMALMMLARYEESLSCFDEALLHRPDLAEAWYNKGVALEYLSQHDEALHCFDEALDRDPEDAESWQGKGVALLMLARYRESLASFEEALRYKPGFAGAWLGKGLGLMMLARCEEALPCFDEALRFSREYAEAWQGKGQALGDLGRHEEAADCFEKALRYKPDFVDAWHNKGMALEKLGRWKQALAAYERARALEED